VLALVPFALTGFAIAVVSFCNVLFFVIVVVIVVVVVVVLARCRRVLCCYRSTPILFLFCIFFVPISQHFLRA
jgi:hypothetical protein